MCAVLQIRTRKFTICVHEVQYMLFGTKKDARSAKMCTPAAQNYDECSAHRGTKTVHTRTLRKKDTKEEKQ